MANSQDSKSNQVEVGAQSDPAEDIKVGDPYLQRAGTTPERFAMWIKDEVCDHARTDWYDTEEEARAAARPSYWINKLPDYQREYIHMLESKCDPTGDLQSLRSCTEQRDGLLAQVQEMMAKLNSSNNGFVSLEAALATSWSAPVPAEEIELPPLGVPWRSYLLTNIPKQQRDKWRAKWSRMDEEDCERHHYKHYEWEARKLFEELERREQQLLAALQDAASAKAERDEALEQAAHSERCRQAYQEAKHKMYEAGGAISEFAFEHMPCNEGALDRMSRRILFEPWAAPIRARAEAAEQANQTLRVTIRELRDALSKLLAVAPVNEGDGDDAELDAAYTLARKTLGTIGDGVGKENASV